MRTTLTLDSDVAALLKRLVKLRKASFKQLVNDALRHGLPSIEAPPAKGSRTYTRPVNLGRCLVESIDDVAEVLAVGEGENYK